MVDFPIIGVAGIAQRTTRTAQGRPTMRPTKLNAILGVVLGVIGISKADAGCVGGEQIAAGNYTVGISGKQTSGSNEELIGMLTSDGKCCRKSEPLGRAMQRDLRDQLSET